MRGCFWANVLAVSEVPHPFPLNIPPGPWPAVWAFSLSSARLISRGLTPGHRLGGIRSLITFGKPRSPLGYSEPYLRQACAGASPKAISGRTSYLRVRLEFLRYPHLIPTLFNGCGFGPPQPLTAASSWTRIGHPVSGLRGLNHALLRLGFPPAPPLQGLSHSGPRSSPDRSTKSTRSRP